MRDWCLGQLRANSLSLGLVGVLVVLVGLLYATDYRLGLHTFASNRCRFHAIPVAVSVLYHNRPHDYTADRSLAMRFQNTRLELDQQIADAINSPTSHSGTYFWVADDRGLADFVIVAFRLFGPQTRSLTNFYFAVLAATIALFVVGYWKSPAALLLPVFAMLTWLGIAEVLPYPTPFPNAQGEWAERVPLCESRLFDVLALTAALHLAVLVAGRRVHRATWLTAVPQAALLVFLYHSRSSIGWQYLGLGVLISLRLGWWAVCRVRAVNLPTSALVRPLFVALLLGTSLVGLKQYQRRVYHPGYQVEHGQRTFWHNALMGLTYHPELRAELPIPLCEDRCTAEFVLAKMAERDANIDSAEWNIKSAMNSLGNHNSFSWDRYEATAREVYLEQWQTRPHDMAICYGYYKPRAIGGLAARLLKREGTAVVAGEAFEFLVGFSLVCSVLVWVIARARLDDDFRAELQSVVGVVAALVPFSLIPGIAFYPAITTVACFYLLAAAAGGLAVVLLASSRRCAKIQSP